MKTKIGILELLAFLRCRTYLHENHQLPSADYHNILLALEYPTPLSAVLFFQKTILPHSCLTLTEAQRRERTRRLRH
jgi:hypothetical protein